MIPDAELNVDNLKVSQLKVECKARELKATGRKAELKARLQEYLDEHANDEPPPPAPEEPEAEAEAEAEAEEPQPPPQPADDEGSDASSTPAPPPAPQEEDAAPADEAADEVADEPSGPAVEDLTQTPADQAKGARDDDSQASKEQERPSDPGEMTRTFSKRPLGFSVSQDKNGRAFATFHDNAAQFVIWKIGGASVDGVEFMHVIELLKTEPMPMKITFKKMGVVQGGSKRFVPNSSAAVTNSVRIDGFKRPLRTTKVTDELKNFGTVEKFWINSIKTHCYVTFSTEEEAVAAREGLHNVYFPRDIDPVFAGRLKVEYVTQQKVENAIEAAGNKSLTAKERERLMKKKRRRDEDKPDDEEEDAGSSKKKKKKEKKKKKKRRTADSLFKKSKSKPHLYFMPLTEEQVARKDTAQKLARRLTEARERRDRGRDDRRGGGGGRPRRRSRSRGRRRR